MDNLIRQHLQEMIRRHGTSLCDDTKRCKAMLNDLCPTARREIRLLISALEEEVGSTLLRPPNGMPVEMLLQQLIKKLHEELSLQQEAAHWAVETWALALSVIQQPLPGNSTPNSVRTPTNPVQENPSTSFAASEVQHEKPLIQNRYRDHGDGTVTDIQTALQWMRCAIGQEWRDGRCQGEVRLMNLENAMALKINFAGHSDWRLPTIEELRSLVYCSSGKPAYFPDDGKCCDGAFQRPTLVKEAFPDAPELWFWSSSAYSGSSSNAWSVYFGYGDDHYNPRFGSSAVRLVRGGQ